MSAVLGTFAESVWYLYNAVHGQEDLQFSAARSLVQAAYAAAHTALIPAVLLSWYIFFTY